MLVKEEGIVSSEIPPADRIILSVDHGSINDLRTVQSLHKAVLWKRHKSPIVKVGHGLLSRYSMEFLRTRNMSGGGSLVMPFLDCNYLPVGPDDDGKDVGLAQLSDALGSGYITVYGDCGLAGLKAVAASRGHAKLIVRAVSEYALRSDVPFVHESPADKVCRLGALAAQLKVSGIITSGHEIAALRAQAETRKMELFAANLCMTASETSQDTRQMTPAEAREAGADYVVIPVFDLLCRKDRHPNDDRPDYERATETLQEIVDTLP